MKTIKYLQYLLIAIGIVAVSLLVFSRHEAETKLDAVELAADYKQFEEFAARERIPMREVLSRLVDAGFTSVVLYEEDLKQLSKTSDFSYRSYMRMKDQVNWKEHLPEEMVRHLTEAGGQLTMIAETADPMLYDTLVDNMTIKYGSALFSTFSKGRSHYIVIHGDYYLKNHPVQLIDPGYIKKDHYEMQLFDIGLGFDEKKIELAGELGLKVVLRPSYFSLADAETQISYYKRLLDKDFPYSKTILFSGDTAIGFNRFGSSHYLDFANDLLGREFRLGMFEAEDQLGFYHFRGDDQLAKDMRYHVVRTYVIPEYIRKRINYLGQEGPKEIENSIYRAVTDRNISMVLIRPFFQSNDWFVSDLDVYEHLIGGLRQRLLPHGISIGEAGRIGFPLYSKWLYLFLAYAMGSLFLLTLKSIYRNAWLDGGLTVLMILVMPALLYLKEQMTVQLLALFSTIFFPLLAILVGMRYMKWQSDRLRRPSFGNAMFSAMCAFVFVTGISLVGAFFTAGLLSRTEYLLEFWHFKGVKLSLILPAFLSIPLYFIVFGFFSGEVEDARGTVKKLLKTPVQIYMLLFVGVVGVVSLIYLMRSGNAGTTSSTEELFRNFLENTLIVRPRNKEFLFAFPALILGIFLSTRGYKKLLFPFVISAMLGLSSIQNSFCHTRTPIRISFYRSVLSILISLAIGVLLILVAEIVHRTILRFKERRAK